MAKKPTRGRPAVEVKKKAFPVMLEPQYIKYLKDMAANNNMAPQEMVRKGLFDYFGNPFKPKAAEGYNVPKIKPPKG